MFKTLFTTVGDVLAPPRCVGCLQEMTWLCHSCHQHVYSPFLSCIVCEKKNIRGLTCGKCVHATRLAGVISVGSYRSRVLQRGIQWLKFKNIRALAPLLTELLIPRVPLIAPLKELRQTALLVPIPLHPRRQRQRGFNQSEDITYILSRYTRIPYQNILTRSRFTWTQSQLPLELRKTNTAQAFTLQTLPSRSLIILVDDVTTSGSTLHSAALVFPKNYTIWGATIARG